MTTRTAAAIGGALAVFIILAIIISGNDAGSVIEVGLLK